MIKINGSVAPCAFDTKVVARMFTKESDWAQFIEEYESVKKYTKAIRKPSDQDLMITKAYLKEGKSLKAVAKMFRMTEGKAAGAVMRVGRDAYLTYVK